MELVIIEGRGVVVKVEGKGVVVNDAALAN